MHTIHVKNLGPIIECTLDINQFNVFTGPQSNGKSTIAKAIYYSRSIKPRHPKHNDARRSIQGCFGCFNWKSAMQARMKDKFLQIFGTSWIMPSDMALDYTYGNSRMALHVSLSEDTEHYGRNFINIRFSDGFIALLKL